MKWLITGGCGFIGANLIKKLIEEGNHEIVVLDNFSVDTGDNVGYLRSLDNVEIIFSDLMDIEKLINLCPHGIDVIVHLAASSGVRESVEQPVFWFENNVVTTLNMLELARRNQIDNFIFSSSSASIGDCDPPIHEELPMHPISPYGASKSCCEMYLIAYYHSYGMDTVSLRFSNVYGPMSAHKQSVVAKFVNKIVNNETIEIYGNGQQTRDFIYVEDLVGAIIIAAKKDDVGGETFQLSSGVETTINEITKKITDRFHWSSIDIDNIPPKVGDILTNWADNTKIKERLGWEPEVSLDNGLEKTIDWFLENIK